MTDQTGPKRVAQRKGLSVLFIVSIAVIAVLIAVLSDAAGTWLALALICLAAFAGGWVASVLRQTKSTKEMQGLYNHMAQFIRAQDGVQDPVKTRDQQGVASLYDAFDAVTKIVASDHARAQQSSEDRTILVREVHHRVKNNLQLVSSIMSMHMRATSDAEVIDTLARIQDRVASLATVHSDLYQGSAGGVIPMAPLLNEIADSAEDLAHSGDHVLRIKRHIAEVGLLPDQAVPLSLLTAEALHTVLRNIPADSNGPEYLCVSFNMTDDCVLQIEIAGPEQEEPVMARSVGKQLLQAHAMQLGAKTQEYWDDGVHHYVFTFAPVGLKAVP